MKINEPPLRPEPIPPMPPLSVPSVSVAEWMLGARRRWRPGRTFYLWLPLLFVLGSAAAWSIVGPRPAPRPRAVVQAEAAPQGDTFGARFVTPVRLVRVAPPVMPEPAAAPPAKPAPPPPTRAAELLEEPPAATLPKPTKLDDICARHHLRRVEYNRGRSWRCRK